MTAIVIGGGPAGLVAANHLIDAGIGVTVLEARARAGGRAASDVVDGFTLNQGPHALYLAGAARRELRALGIDPPGRLPSIGLAVTIDREGRFSSLARGDAARFGMRLARTKPAEVAHLTAAEWAGEDRLAAALVRLASYTGALDRLSADAAVGQARIAFFGVRYLHGGWQALVGLLADRARARGVVIERGAAVRWVAPDRGGWIAATDDAEYPADVVVLASGGPQRASRLLGIEFEPPGPEAVASVLDLGLKRLPRRFRRFALGLDEPRFATIPGPPVRVAEHGVLLSLASYGEAPREALEAFADALQPGWREEQLMSRFLPRMTTISAIPTPERGGLAGRPGVEVPGAPGAFLAGDWVGPEGLLLDAALSSAAAAARGAIAAATAVSPSDPRIEPVAA